jgi:uncharacterized membrane protein (DUF485 family)
MKTRTKIILIILAVLLIYIITILVIAWENGYFSPAPVITDCNRQYLLNASDILNGTT